MEWKREKLRDVCISPGEYGANATAILFEKEHPRYIRITDIDDYGNLIEEDKAGIEKKKAKNYILKNNDFLFARTGDTIGKSLLYKKEMGLAAYAGYLIKFTFNQDKILPEYFNQIAKSEIFEAFKIAMQKVGAKPNINSRDYGSFKFDMPKDLKEQIAITSILTKVDEAIEATQKSIKAAERLKKALMQNLLSGKLKSDGTWRTEDEFYEDEKFGKVPVGWTVKKLSKVFFVNDESLPSKTEPTFKFRYITIESVSTEHIDFESCPQYEFRESPGRARRIMKNEDILISGVRPNLKAFAIYNNPDGENWICSTGFYVLTAKEEEDSKFYFYQILSEIGEKQFHSYVAGTNYPAIGDREIKNMKLYCPNYNEQLLISKKIAEFSEFIFQKLTKIQTLQRLKKSLMQNLLTGKVRVDLDKINELLKEQEDEHNYPISMA